MSKNSCGYRSSEQSTKAWFRSQGIIDKYLNILDLNKFRKETTKWSNFARTQWGVSGRIFKEQMNGTRVAVNQEMFRAIDYAKKKGATSQFQLDDKKPTNIKIALDDILTAYANKEGVINQNNIGSAKTALDRFNAVYKEDYGYKPLQIVRISGLNTNVLTTTYRIVPTQEAYKAKPVNEQTKKEVNKNLNNRIQEWLKQMGIGYKSVDTIVDREGNEISATAKADMLQKVVEVVEGKMDATTLPEEAAHFLVELLGENHALVKGMMNRITDYQLYDDVVRDYSEMYNNDERALKKEAVGKMIAYNLTERYTDIDSQPDKQKKSKSWFKLIWNYIKSLFGKINSDTIKNDPFKLAADIIDNQEKLDESLTSSEGYSGTADIFYQMNKESREELKNKLKNDSSVMDKKEINTEEIGGLQAELKKIVERYFNIETGKVFKNRVTDLSTKLLKRGRSIEDLKKIENNPNNLVKSEVGTRVHLGLELLVHRELNRLKNNKNIEVDEIVVKNELDIKGMIGFDKKHTEFKLLKDVASKTVDRIIQQQKEINPNGKVWITTEQIVISEKEDMAGTMDLLAIYSDGSVGIWDYKTMMPSKQYMTYSSSAGRYVLNNDKLFDVKKDYFNTQLHKYREILEEEYGVKKFRQTRVIPLHVQLSGKKDKDGNFLYNTNVKSLDTEQTNELLREIPIVSESTHKKGIDKLLTKLRIRNDELKARQDKTVNYAEKQQFAELIRTNNNNIKMLLLDRDLNGTLVQIQTLITAMHNRLEQDKHIRQQTEEGRQIVTNPEYMDARATDDFKNELSLYEDLTEYFTEHLEDIRSEKGDEFADKVEKTLITYSGKVKNALTALGTHRDNVLVRELKEAQQVDTEEIGQDMGIISKTFHRFSEMDHPIFKTAWRMVSKQTDKIRFQEREIFNEIEAHTKELSKWAKQNGMSLTQAYDKLINYDTKTVRNMHSRLSKEFFEAKKKAEASVDVEWMKKHYSLKNNWKEIYNENKKNFQRRVDREGAPNEELGITEEDVANEKKERMAAWERQNNIEKYPKSAYFSPWKYAYIELADSVFDQYKTKEFKYIEQNKPLLDFYEMFEKYNQTFREVLGARHGDIPNNFVPKIRRDTMEDIANNQFSISRLVRDFKGSFIARNDDQMINSIDAEGNEQRNIPIFFVNNLTTGKKGGEAAVDEQSNDLGRSLHTFAKMAYNYKYMGEIEAQFNALLDALEANRDGQHILNAKGEKAKGVYNQLLKMTSKNPQNLTKLLSEFRDYYIYGVKIQDKEREAGGVELTRSIKRIKNYHSVKNLGFAIIPGLAAAVAGRIGVIAEGMTGKYFNRTSAGKAFKMLRSSNKETREKAMYILRFMEPYQEEQTFQRQKKLASKKMRKWLDPSILFFPYRKADEHLDNVTTLAVALEWGFDTEGNLSKVSKGKASESIWEGTVKDRDGYVIKGITDHGYNQFRRLAKDAGSGIKGNMSEEDIKRTDLHLAGDLMMHYKNWMPGLLTERFGKTIYDKEFDIAKQGRYRALYNNLTVNHDSKKFLTFTATVTVPALTRVITDAATFGLFKFKVNEKRAEYLWNKYREKNKSDMSFESYKDMMQGQTRGAIGELRFLLSFTAMILMLGADWDDDGKKNFNETWATRQLYKLLNKADSELRFAYTPDEFIRLVSNPMPVSGILVDLKNTLSNMTDEALIKPITGKENPYDKSPFGYYGVSWIPLGIQQLRNVVEPFEQDKKYGV